MIPALHEFGEWTALTLALVGITEPRVNRLLAKLHLPPCWCSALREQLNDLGEHCWARLDPHAYSTALIQFELIVRAATARLGVSEDDLHRQAAKATHLSRRGFYRWMDRLEKNSSLSHVSTFPKINGRPVKVRIYGVPGTEPA